MVRRIFGFLMCLVSIGMAIALVTPAAANSQEKVYVCKYVGTPGVDEILQTGQNPIEVSVNAILMDPVIIGSYFADSQGRSYVLGYVPMVPEPTAADCPQTPTPTNTSTATSTFTPTNTNTPVFTPTNTNTPVFTPTNTHVPTATDTNTPGPSPTATSTVTPGPSPTPTSTNTPGPSPTLTNTNTPGPSPTATETVIPPVPPNTAGQGSRQGTNATQGFLWILDIVIGLFGLGFTFAPGTRKVRQ